ncbi:LysM peptidoglycan-binding domain-containing protein [Aurantibacter sp.]|uniref:PBP1 and LysM peptidoglycan-binding domain-containing protein n=1 Tax=Aurantibacter sp. TaxID=2807103 RepID=UPI0035C86FBE
MMKRLLILVCFFTLASCITVKAQNFITHKVEANETVSSIATKYNVTKTQIYDLNPDSKKELKLDAILIIPNNAKTGVTDTKVDTTAVQIVESLKDFKIHKVKRKETLYSLSKLYKVTQEDIKKHNPELYANNLRKGDEIKIPVFKKEVVEIDSSVESNSELPAGKYIVKAKEGKWRIAYTYGITVEELETLNPQLTDGLKVGDTINIPVKEVTEIKAVDDKYSYYTVLAQEGFYRLKIKLGLSQEELELLNPELKTLGLKEGMLLKIPFDKSALNSEVSSNLSVNDSLLISGKPTSLLPLVKDKSLKKIAYMLPFKLNTIELDSIRDTNNRIENDRLLNLSLEFYSGAEMALDSLKTLGFNLDVQVIDTQNKLSTCLEFTDGIISNETDVVIGPFMPSNFNMVAKKLLTSDIPVINPLTKKVDLGNNVFQSKPSDALLQQKIINYFKKDSTSHFVIIHDSKNIASKDILKQAFPNASIVASRLDKKTKKDDYFVYDLDIVNALKPGKNIIFLETQKEGFVSNATSILNSKNNLTDMSVFLTTTDYNNAFEGDEVSNDHLSQLNFTFPTIAKMNNEDENRSFIDAYQAKYNETPSSFATRGFDLTMDVVLRISTSETLYHSVRQVPLTKYVENKFSYTKSLLGGFQNEAVFLVKYDGLNIVEVE